MATCSKCGASIIWVKSNKGKWMPLNEGLVPYHQNQQGKDFIVTDRGEVIRCDRYPGDKVPEGQLPTGLARVAHWATCPFADDFRKRGGKNDN